MRTLIATDSKLFHKKDKYYIDNALLTIIKRYKKHFGDILLCTRVVEIDQVPAYCKEVTPYLSDVIGVDSLKNIIINKYNAKFKDVISECDFVIARLPSLIALKVVETAKALNKPYLTELMGCAWDAYWNHSLQGKMFAPYMYYKMKKQVNISNFSIYVTEKFLQNRYPAQNVSEHASNVYIEKLDAEILQNRLNNIKNQNKKTIKLFTAAAVDVRYKGHEYVIKALPKFKDINLEYYIAGKGDQTFLKNIAKKSNVENKVFFLGGLSHEDVIEMMDKTDLYIQPSKQEGLPRAVIEAMSRGCPTLGANTAGIPELIQKECVFKRGSVDSVYKAINSFVGKDWEEYAISNFNKAKQFEEDILNQRREKYFNMIKKEVSKNNRNTPK